MNKINFYRDFLYHETDEMKINPNFNDSFDHSNGIGDKAFPDYQFFPLNDRNEPGEDKEIDTYSEKLYPDCDSSYTSISPFNCSKRSPIDSISVSDYLENKYIKNVEIPNGGGQNELNQKHNEELDNCLISKNNQYLSDLPGKFRRESDFNENALTHQNSGTFISKYYGKSKKCKFYVFDGKKVQGSAEGSNLSLSFFENEKKIKIL